MQRFFIHDVLSLQTIYRLPDRIQHQVERVLRYTPGQELILIDQLGHVFLAEWLNPDVLIKQQLSQEVSIKPKITLILGMLKKDKWEYALQKSTELGVDVIVPLITQRTIARWDDNKQKYQRYTYILQEAAEQSERTTIPILEKPIFLKNIETHMSQVNIFAYERQAGNFLNEKLVPTSSITCVIGSEGGFTLEEHQRLVDFGFEAVSFGQRILRSETAVSYILSVLSYHYEQTYETH
jgi:16S rRNA (uracil1498-N3)-methyltransferase